MKGVLGIDVGTTTVKAILFDPYGHALGSEQQEYQTYYPNRSWAEQEPNDWWEVLKVMLQRLTTLADGQGIRIQAVGVSSQAPAFLPLDDEGQPLSRALIWMDRRADEDAQWLQEQLGMDKVASYSRNRPDPFFTAAKLLWFKRNEPERFRKIHKILQVNGYINFRMTGVYSMDESHASITQLYDVNQRSWAFDVLDQFGFPSSMLPDIYPSGEIIGAITAQAALETGLQPGIPVIAGTVDGVAAALEAGVIEPGIAAEMTGTSSVLLTSNDKGWYSPELISMNHALPDQTLALGAMTSTGASLKWFRDQFCQTEIRAAEQSGRSAYEIMNTQVENSNPLNDIVFLPYMLGERSPIWDSDARGVFFGLSLHSSRADMMRAVMEGAAFALKNNLDFMEKSGVRIQTLRMLGGQSNSQIWNQIKADVMNREIDIVQESGGAPLGVAMLAGKAVGFYPDLPCVLNHVMKLKKKVAPSAKMHQFYSKKYQIFLELYQQTKEQFKQISALFKEVNS